MTDTKKEQKREELHRAIRAIADEFRSAVDGWDFKNYVLGTMFYRYISENLANYINSGEQEAENTEFCYAKMSDAGAEDTGEKIDTVKRNAEIEEIVAHEQVLRDEIAKIIAEIEVGV